MNWLPAIQNFASVRAVFFFAVSFVRHQMALFVDDTAARNVDDDKANVGGSRKRPVFTRSRVRTRGRSCFCSLFRMCIGFARHSCSTAPVCPARAAMCNGGSASLFLMEVSARNSSSRPIIPTCPFGCNVQGGYARFPLALPSARSFTSQPRSQIILARVQLATCAACLRSSATLAFIDESKPVLPGTRVLLSTALIRSTVLAAAISSSQLEPAAVALAFQGEQQRIPIAARQAGGKESSLTAHQRFDGGVSALYLLLVPYRYTSDNTFGIGSYRVDVTLT